MRFTFRHADGSRGMSWAARAVVAAVLVSGSTAATAGIAAAQVHSAAATAGIAAAQVHSRSATAGIAAQVHPSGPSTATSAVVVKEAFRMGFGKILVTAGTGSALYFNPAGCNATCRGIWPPLTMPSGATVPKGAPCLATASLGHKLQVTYHKARLYTFTNDTGHSVTGNGVAGFHVAKVTKACKAAAR